MRPDPTSDKIAGYDATGAAAIAVAPNPERGLGAAINDTVLRRRRRARVIYNAGRRSVFSSPFITGGESHGAGDRFAGWPVSGAASYPYSAAFFISG